MAAAYYHEAQLRRAHPAFSQPPGCREELLGRAERALRAGLRREPASAGLWTALGTVAVDVSGHAVWWRYCWKWWRYC